MTKQDWIRMRLAMVRGRPIDDCGPIYSAWFAAYVATDKLDPGPLGRVFTLGK